MMVLLAEDDPGTLRLLQKAIQGCGHEVVTAANGQQAWETFAAGAFNFVVTDWLMPGLDGMELCGRIRASVRASYVYVIMVTAQKGQEDLLAGLSAGADDFIRKPVDARELQFRMRAAERVLRLERDLRETNQQLELMNARLRRLTRLDSLMQIGNRLAFEERIADFHDRAARYGECYSVVLCDVDRFKGYNDTHGHLAGDEVLRRVSSTMHLSLRGSDGAFRYGGEEIVILLPQQSFREAAVAAERLRARVEALQLPRLDACPSPVVTISCGVASYPLEAQRPAEWETVLEWADQALYRAKNRGRNRVELADACQPCLQLDPVGVQS